MSVRGTDLAWLAGIIDGEGNISYGRNSARGTAQVRISIHSTSYPLLRRVCEILNEMGVVYSVVEKRNENTAKYRPEWKPCFTVTVGGSKHAYALLTALAEQLTEKQEQALCLLDYLEWRLTKVPLHFSRRPDLSASVAERRDRTADMLRSLKKERMKDPKADRLSLVGIQKESVNG